MYQIMFESLGLFLYTVFKFYIQLTPNQPTSQILNLILAREPSLAHPWSYPVQKEK